MPAVNLESAVEGRPEDAAAQLVAHYRRIADSLPGEAIEAVRQMRDEAMVAFTEQGLPNRRVEEWKYTDLRRMMGEAYAPAETQVEITRSQLDEALGDAAGIEATRLVFVNGHYSQELSDAIETPAGVELMTLAKALYAPADWLLAALGKVNKQERETVSLLNTAFMTDGFVLHLSENAALETPLHIIHVSAGETPVTAAIRNVIVAEEGASAILLESYVSIGETESQVNAMAEVRAAPRAKIRHYKLSGENLTTQHLSNVMVELAEEADYLAVDFADGTALSRHQTFMRFNGDNARGHFHGAQLLLGRQHCDMTLVVDHAAVGCESRERVKAVLADQAHGVFQAKVIVQPGAQQTDGNQMAQSLLLSENAEFAAKPELEIYADDVKCNHGATSGAPDEDLMFYLRSRGLTLEQARSLLIQAFVGDIVDHVEHEALHEVLMNRTARWLG